MSFIRAPWGQGGLCGMSLPRREGRQGALCPAQPHRALLGKVWEVFTCSVMGIALQ